MPDSRGLMPRAALRGTAALSLLLAALAAAVAREPGKSAKGAPDKAFAKVKREYQQKARNKKPAERLAALKLLEDYRTGDAADLVYVTLLDDKTDSVRQAAIEFLADLRDDSEVMEKLVKRMISAGQKEGLDVKAVGALQAIAGGEDESLQNRLIAYLDEMLGTQKADQALLHAMIDHEAPKGDPAYVLRMLNLFSRTQFFDHDFGFRRCVVQGIMEVKDPDGLTQLIQLLPDLKGLVQFDAVTHLIAATGQNFGDNAAKWKAWWVENRGKNRTVDRSRPPPPSNYGNFGQYYGIPICAKRVVFVLDTSLSMRGAKIDAAKTELVRAIRELPKEVFFDVIAFDNTARVWRPEPVPANEQNKIMAINVVMEQPLKLKTASYDALEAAFELHPEAIYFLSDGQPMGGKIDDPKQIIATVSEANRVRRVSIHSIGIATNESNVFADFMKGLAEANWGIYKPVN